MPLEPLDDLTDEQRAQKQKESAERSEQAKKEYEALKMIDNIAPEKFLIIRNNSVDIDYPAIDKAIYTLKNIIEEDAVRSSRSEMLLDELINDAKAKIKKTVTNCRSHNFDEVYGQITDKFKNSTRRLYEEHQEGSEKRFEKSTLNIDHDIIDYSDQRHQQILEQQVEDIMLQLKSDVFRHIGARDNISRAYASAKMYIMDNYRDNSIGLKRDYNKVVEYVKENIVEKYREDYPEQDLQKDDKEKEEGYQSLADAFK